MEIFWSVVFFSGRFLPTTDRYFDPCLLITLAYLVLFTPIIIFFLVGIIRKFKRTPKIRFTQNEINKVFMSIGGFNSLIYMKRSKEMKKFLKDTFCPNARSLSGSHSMQVWWHHTVLFVQKSFLWTFVELWDTSTLNCIFRIILQILIHNPLFHSISRSITTCLWHKEKTVYL